MAVSFSSFVGFTSSLNHPHESRTCWRTSIKNSRDMKSSGGAVHWILSPTNGRTKLIKFKVLSNGDSIVTDTTSPDVQNTETDKPFSPSPLISESSNLDIAEESQDPKKSVVKRSPLTAREKVRAARVLSRYTAESKATKKPAMGSKLIEALKEADKGKKTAGLPEAPTNIFDDSKRGMPKAGLTFDFPGGADLFFIVFSFVFISTIMFATTYLVWKVGAIHFNES